MHGDRRPAAPARAADGSPRCDTGADDELWSYGDEVYAILTRFLRLREALRPYLRRLMTEAHQDGQPVMRPMFHVFPDDPPCWELDDQYMFGPDTLVAPVTSAGTTSHSVYLPPKPPWYDAWTGARYDAGGYVDLAAPLQRIPVFTRDTALLEVFADEGDRSE